MAFTCTSTMDAIRAHEAVKIKSNSFWDGRLNKTVQKIPALKETPPPLPIVQIETQKCECERERARARAVRPFDVFSFSEAEKMTSGPPALSSSEAVDLARRKGGDGRALTGINQLTEQRDRERGQGRVTATKEPNGSETALEEEMRSMVYGLFDCVVTDNFANKEHPEPRREVEGVVFMGRGASVLEAFMRLFFLTAWGGKGRKSTGDQPSAGWWRATRDPRKDHLQTWRR